jgi:hypothetical protein
MATVALPEVSIVAAEVYVPLLTVTDPVGVALPEPPLTATVTESDCAVVILDAEGETVKTGATGPGAVNVTDAVPEAVV